MSPVIPVDHYGVLQKDLCESDVHEIAEQVRRIGYAVLDSGLSENAVRDVSGEFNRVRNEYLLLHGRERLQRIKEIDIIRAPMFSGSRRFLDLAMNRNLLAAVRLLVPGKVILNQQNGIINPPRAAYSQGAWHRDLPYQHFVSSMPLAINALFCVDEFTRDNGSTYVIPASHRSAAFPTETYIRRNAVQLEARAGQYILLDCMAFHCGGYNASESERRAVNHVYTIPFFKQQINLPRNMGDINLTDEEREVLGFKYEEPKSLDEYLSSRIGRAEG